MALTFRRRFVGDTKIIKRCRAFAQINGASSNQRALVAQIYKKVQDCTLYALFTLDLFNLKCNKARSYMDHVKVIRAFIETLMKSESFHALVVQSAPGWGKTTTVNAALSDLGVEVISAGSYATPLHFFNLLCRHPDRIILLDDCAGLLHDPKAMAILKAATWFGANPLEGGAATPRRVSWGSTSEKVEQDSVEFSGKLILLSNTVPAGKESEAFLSRALHYKIEIDSDDVGTLLLAAAESPGHFSDQRLAREVALFLLESRPHATGDTLNLRTLKLGYEIAAIHPSTWKTLLPHLVPAHLPESHFNRILKMSGPVKEQEAKFVSTTGLSRRTFYYRKRNLGATRPYKLRTRAQY